MMNVNFLYEGKKILIQCTKNITMKEIFERFEIKVKAENDSLYYLYNGNQLNKDMKLEELIGKNDINKDININIIVNSIDDTNNKNLIKSKYIKCPKCQEDIRIKINDYKIKLYECKNRHNIDNILLEEYENIEKIDISKIICNICNINNRSNTYNNDFYICNTCQINICPLCKTKHDKNHNIIKYEDKGNICEIHNENYIKYCIKCKKNICMFCFNQHNNHELILYDNIIPDTDNIKNEMIKLKNSIDIFKSDIKIIINKLNDVIKNIEI